MPEQPPHLAVEKAASDAQAAELGAELASLRRARAATSRAALELRTLLCPGAEVAEADLPFAGELIAVREEHAEWEGAAERVLHSFGLSLLVPDRALPARSAAGSTSTT